jgi:cytochrome c oxidase subunit 1
VIGALSSTIMGLNVAIAWSVLALALFQLPFIYNFFHSIFAGPRVENDNPWLATTLEWQTPSPPPHGNFVEEVVVYRGAYDYSLAFKATHSSSTPEWGPEVDEPLDFEPQNQPPSDAGAIEAAVAEA